MARLRTRKHKVVLNRSVGGDLGITLMLTFLGAFMFLPMLYVVMQSLKPLDELWMFPPRFIVMNPTLNNFSDLFVLMNTSWVPFSRYIFNTVLVSVAGTAGNLLFASMCAYALAKIKFPGRKWIFKTIRTSLMFHETVTAVTRFTIMSVLLLIDTPLALIIPAWGSTLGLYLMKNFMSQIPDDLIEAATVDGAGYFRIFWSIFMPNIKSAWITVVILVFQRLWNRGTGSYIYTESLKNLPTLLSQISGATVSTAGISAAASVIMMLPPIIVFVFSQNQVVETMAHAAIKE